MQKNRQIKETKIEQVPVGVYLEQPIPNRSECHKTQSVFILTGQLLAGARTIYRK